MESKIILFVVLATVARSSAAELPSALTSDFSKILSSEIQARNGFTTAFEVMFDQVINAYTGKKSIQRQGFREVAIGFANASDGILQGVEVVGNSSITVNQTAAAAAIEEIVDLLSTGLELASSRNPPATKAEIEAIAEEIILLGQDFVSSIFAIIKNISDPEAGVIAAIENTEAAAISDVTIAFRVYFGALEILRVEVSSGTQSRSGDGLIAILTSQRLALSAMQDEVDTEFDLFRFLRLIKYSNKTETAVYFSEIITGEKETFDGFRTGLENIFSVISNSLGTKSVEEISTAFIAAHDGIGKAIQAIQFENYTATNEDAANAAIEYVVQLIDDGIELARSGTDLSVTLAGIAAIETEVIDEIIAIFESIFQQVADASSKDYNVVSRIESIEKDAIGDVTLAFRAVFKSIKFLATTACSKPQTETEDSIAIIATELTTILAMKDEARIKFELLRDLFIAAIVKDSEIQTD